MIIGIPKEVHPGEKRVAITPEVANKIQKMGFKIKIQTGAGQQANFPDESIEKAGCEIIQDAKTLWSSSDIILKVRAPEEPELLNQNQTLISFIYPAQNEKLLQKLAATGANVLAMDCVPRISRAQKLDALSSMANIAGYRAVVEAAQHFDRFFMGQITAAGKVPPAKVLVIGAGVAGLAAIGAANSLGAQVRAFDTRPEVKEQVQSMGAEFLEISITEEGSGAGGYAKQMSEEYLRAEHDLFLKQAREVDVIITTALIPGKKAPRLISNEMVQAMKPGSVIVDLAAEQGGNCELTIPGEVVISNNVKILGFTDLPSRLASQSSQLYATNLWRLLEELTPNGKSPIELNMSNEVIRGVTVIKSGEITWPAPPITPSPKPVSVPKSQAQPPAPTPKKKSSPWWTLSAGLLSLLLIGSFAPEHFTNQLTVFVLSCFVGYMVVWNVSASLHTPLMSVTNAISGIIALGAILQISSDSLLVQILAGSAVLVATINIAGGFLVSHRMLKMFKK